MMNKKIIGIVTGILLLGGLVWLAAPSGDGQVAPTEEANYDFGSISMAAGKVKHTFSVRNESDETITIGKMYTSCMCTTATLVIGSPSTGSGSRRFGPYGMPGHGFISAIGEELAPGEKATVEAVFDPAAHGPAGIGRVQRTIVIENSRGEPLQLSFTAEVTP